MIIISKMADASQNFVCQAVGSISSRTLTSPLEVVKVLSQVGTTETTHGFLKTFYCLAKEQGFRAFWKGNGISCLRFFPYSAVQLTVFNNFKSNLVDVKYSQLTATSSLIASSTSGLLANIITYPADMVKTRLIVQNISGPKYHGICHAFNLICKEEGMRAFYKGIMPTLLGVIPFAAGTVLAYDMIDKFGHKQLKDMTSLESFLTGCSVAAIAQTLSFPFDTIRRKLQAQSASIPGGGGIDVEFNGMIDAFIQTIKKNGLVGLWRGTLANLLKVVPHTGLMFIGFEYSKRTFLYQNGFTVSPSSDSPRQG